MRVVGIDPGSASIGLAVGTLAHIEECTTIEVGHEEPLPVPRTVRRADGTELTIRNRRVMPPADVDKAVLAVAQHLRRWAPDRVVIEWVHDVHLEPSVHATRAASMATGIARSAWLGGEIRATCRMMGTPVDLVTQRRWSGDIARGVVSGGTKGGRRGTTAEVVEGRYPELVERRANEHERDAAGMVLWRALAEDLERQRQTEAVPEIPVKERRAPKPPKPVKQCDCLRRHKRTCRFYQPMTYTHTERWQKEHTPWLM